VLTRPNVAAQRHPRAMSRESFEMISRMRFTSRYVRGNVARAGARPRRMARAAAKPRASGDASLSRPWRVAARARRRRQRTCWPRALFANAEVRALRADVASIVDRRRAVSTMTSDLWGLWMGPVGGVARDEGG